MSVSKQMLTIVFTKLTKLIELKQKNTSYTVQFIAPTRGFQGMEAKTSGRGSKSLSTEDYVGACTEKSQYYMIGGICLLLT